MGLFTGWKKCWSWDKILHIMLVGGWPTPLKNDGVKVNWDDGIPNWMENHKIPWFQSTNQYRMIHKSRNTTGYLTNILLIKHSYKPHEPSWSNQSNLWWSKHGTKGQITKKIKRSLANWVKSLQTKMGFECWFPESYGEFQSIRLLQ